jgi:hypothetical protein
MEDKPWMNPKLINLHKVEKYIMKLLVQNTDAQDSTENEW